MMIMGRETLRFDPTVSRPPWDTILEAPTNDDGSAMLEELTTMQLRHVRPNVKMAEYVNVYDVEEEYGDVQMDDHFRIYEFKVRMCARERSHDWTECPYAHPGEKARRRDPRKFHYSGDPCSDFRRGSCRKGDTCEFAHGVFECWLHPSRYRTQPCDDGFQCSRRICFFAHNPDQIRVLPTNHHASTHSNQFESYDGSPSRLGRNSQFTTGSFGWSPTSTLYFHHCSTPVDSPPMSPVSSLGPNSIGDLASTMRNLQIGKATRLGMSSPRIPYAGCLGVKAFEQWDEGCATEEWMMERVESGKKVRARIYAKLSRDNSLGESCGM